MQLYVSIAGSNNILHPVYDFVFYDSVGAIGDNTNHGLPCRNMVVISNGGLSSRSLDGFW